MRKSIGKPVFIRQGRTVRITCRLTDPKCDARLQLFSGVTPIELSPHIPEEWVDIKDKEAAKNAIQSLPHDFKKIDVLVNNAGLAAGLSTIQEGNTDDWDLMIDTNVKGLLYVSRLIMPLMIANGSGHIINISSIAGKEVYPKGNVYCATKFAVDAITKSMRIDMLEHGIKVTSIDPGAAETEFSLVRFQGDAERAQKTYQGYEPLKGEDIADIAFFAATRPAHVVLNDIVVTCLAQANTQNFYKK